VTQTKINLLDLDRASLEAFFVASGERSFRASQVMKWMHHYGMDDFSLMTNLGKPLRLYLDEHAQIKAPVHELERLSEDGTRKWLFRLEDGNCIETVFIPEKNRGTLCVSSQAGCSLNCSFCSTGRQGYNRNLTVSEIISQIWVANKALGCDPKGERLITNVVFMGMGEPLLNFDNLVKAIKILLDDLAYGLSKRKVTVSTAGVVPAIDRLRTECDVSLAVSLHAPNDDLRDVLMPLNKKYPLRQLLDACKQYLGVNPHRRITFEYVMLAGINDSLKHADEMVTLLSDVPSKINLIPFNPFPNSGYQTSSQTVIDRFRDRLMSAGLMTVTRRTRGDDINAACGQLVGQVKDRTRRSMRYHHVMKEAG
jgi:23S rRNA (adenine2503-C2)-methyltransferase